MNGTEKVITLKWLCIRLNRTWQLTFNLDLQTFIDHRPWLWNISEWNYGFEKKRNKKCLLFYSTTKTSLSLHFYSTRKIWFGCSSIFSARLFYISIWPPPVYHSLFRANSVSYFILSLCGKKTTKCRKLIFVRISLNETFILAETTY